MNLHDHPSARNWNANGLLGTVLQRGERHDSRTTANCSDVCGSIRAVRGQRDDDEIWGTALNCGVSKCKSEATSWSANREVQKRGHGHVVGKLLHGALLHLVLWPLGSPR